MKDRRPPSDDDPMTDKQTINLITDTVVGPNLRWRDNLYQAFAILVCSIVGVAIGCLMTQDRIGGGMLGLVAGMLVGLFGSGIFLMIYRAVQHARGKHD